MELTDTGKAALISGIASDAEQEAEKIVAEAEKQAAEKRQYGEKKAAAVLEEARKRGVEQADVIKKQVAAQVEMEIKRRSLQVRSAVVQDITDRVVAEVRTQIETPGYRDILRTWILEAAQGLATDAAELNASATERLLLDERLLKDINTKLQQQGKAMSITLTDATPLEAQGVVLTAVGGRVAFNNQVKTRMSRQQRRIHMLIHEALFKE